MIDVSSAAAFGTRMSLFICAGKVLEIKMGVDLGGTDVGVTQKFLHAAQITTGFKQMGCERVPEQVRMHVLRQALRARPGGHAQLHRARRSAGRPLRPTNSASQSAFASAGRSDQPARSA